MPVTSAQIDLVQSTWERCIPIADAAAGIFYDRLFALDPNLRTLFPADISEQKRKLMTMLTAAVRGLNDLGTLAPVVAALGRRHVAYGVVEAHYATVGSALLFTLERGLGPAWTPDVAAAWTAVYGLLSETMIAAQRGEGP